MNSRGDTSDTSIKQKSKNGGALSFDFLLLFCGGN